MSSDKMKFFKAVAERGCTVKYPKGSPVFSSEDRDMIGGGWARSKSDDLIEQSYGPGAEDVKRRRFGRADKAEPSKDNAKPAGERSWWARIKARLRGGRR